MGETKFTPGPWWVYRPRKNIYIRDSRGHYVMEGNHYGVRTEHDSHLIAAAPDLYSALDGMVEHYAKLANSGDAGFWNPEDEDAVKAARAALSKARGE